MLEESLTMHTVQEALAAAANILNDDVDRAEEELSEGTSPFHKVRIQSNLL